MAEIHRLVNTVDPIFHGYTQIENPETGNMMDYPIMAAPAVQSNRIEPVPISLVTGDSEGLLMPFVDNDALKDETVATTPSPLRAYI